MKCDVSFIHKLFTDIYKCNEFHHQISIETNPIEGDRRRQHITRKRDMAQQIEVFHSINVLVDMCLDGLRCGVLQWIRDKKRFT